MYRYQCHSVFPLPIPTWSEIFCCIFLLLLSFNLNGQTKSELQQKKESLQKKIQETEELIRKKEASRKATLNDYVALQNQLADRRELIRTIRQTMEQLDQSVRILKDSIQEQEETIRKLKEEHGELLQAAYRLEETGHPLLYLLSSKSLNQAFARWRYLKQFHDYRESQMHQIKENQRELTRKYKDLDSIRTEKDSLLTEELENSKALNQSLRQKNQMLQSLKQDETRLREQLKEQERNKKELDRAIARIIREESAADRPANAPESTLPSAPEYKALTGAFEDNRGKLPWPVERGIVVKRFGRQNHPTLPGVTVTNNGIDITTDKNASVRALFDGSVAGKVFVPGYQNMLIIQHGEYFSVYSRLKSVAVQKGDQVSTGQQIGTVSTLPEEEQTSQVHLEIWKGKSKLDPMSWLISR